MHIAVDLDGTIDAASALFQNLFSTLKAAGHTVTVLTGSSTIDSVSIAGKQNYLNQLGMGDSYSQLVLIPSDDDMDKLSQLKALWCSENGVDILIDNRKANAKAAVAAGVQLVLVPWATRV
jgi:hypothetical protein